MSSSGRAGWTPGGQDAARAAGEGDMVSRLVDIDADVDRLALIEAGGIGRGADDGEPTRLDVGHGCNLRGKTFASLLKSALRSAPRPSYSLSVLGAPGKRDAAAR